MHALNRIIFFCAVLIFVLNLRSQIFIPSGNYQGQTGSLTISDTPSYDFGNNYQNINIDKTFTITNASSSPVMGLSGDLFGTATFNFKGTVFPGTGGTCSNSLQRGNSCTIVVTARGTSSGTVNDTVSLSYKTISGTTNLTLPISIQFNLWTPSALGANLAGWYDAADSATVRTGVAGVSQAANGDPVSVWQDKSGNGRDATQSTAGRYPIYNSTSWTGSKPTVIWDGSDDGLTITGITWQAYSVGIIANHQSVASTRAFLTKRSAVGANFFWFTLTGNAIFWDQNGSGGANRFNTTVVPALNTDYIYLLVRPLTGTNRTQYINGTANGTTATNADDNNANNIILGNDYSAANRGINSKISEVILVTTNLALSDREKVEGYLAWKWGTVGSLPGGHTYKSAPP